MSTKIQIPILIVVGLPCSGKTEFIKIASQKDLLCIEWSQIIKEALSGYAENKKKGSFLNLVEGVVTVQGPSFLTKQILSSINIQLQSGIAYKGIVVSGARNPDEAKFLLEHFEQGKVIMIFSQYTTRFQRCKNRARIDNPKELVEFIKNDMEEYKTGLATIACNMVDGIIFNDNNLLNFENNVKVFIDEYFYSNKTKEESDGTVTVF